MQNQIIDRNFFRHFRRLRRFRRFHFELLYVFIVVAFVMNSTHLQTNLSKLRILSIDRKKKSIDRFFQLRNEIEKKRKIM